MLRVSRTLAEREGDFELAMRGLLGEGAPLSKSSIRRLRAGWTAEFEEWSQRRLEGREVVYVWADGIYVKAGLERDKAALLVVLGAPWGPAISSLMRRRSFPRAVTRARWFKSQRKGTSPLFLHTL